MALIQLGLSRGHPPEHRSSTDPLVAALLGLSATSFSVGSRPWTPAIVEACTLRLGGVLSASDTDPLLRPHLLWLARSLVERGEVVMLLEVSPTGQVELLPVQGYELQGSVDRRRYHQVTVNGPSLTSEFDGVSRQQVIHAILRPSVETPWVGQHWRQVGTVVDQLAACDRAIIQDTISPRGTLLPVEADEGPAHLSEIVRNLMGLKGGIAMHPLLGRNFGERPGPPPKPLRLAPNTLQELLKARLELSASLAESLGFPAPVMSLGATGQIARPDALRSWIGTIVKGWVNVIRAEFARVLERDVAIDLSPALSGLVPVNQRLAAVSRLIKEGFDKVEAMRLGGFNG